MKPTTLSMLNACDRWGIDCTTLEECPVCHHQNLVPAPRRALNPVSRKDNGTYICEDCGMNEAFEDAGIPVRRNQ